jgi:AcrR family transcriptional regulator
MAAVSTSVRRTRTRTRSGTRTRPRIRGDLAQARLLDAAEELFYRDGARNVGIDAVIRLAGVNKMSLYRQYQSKEDLLLHFLRRREATFWDFFDRSLARHPRDPRRQLRQVFRDLRVRVGAPGYRGCPFVNCAAEFPDPAHAVRRRVTAFKVGVLHRLSGLARSAGARRPLALAQALALLFEGAYAASQTHGPGNALLKAIPEMAETMLQRHGV